MSKEQVKQNSIPNYVVEEENEEETFTLDFKNKTAFSKTEGVIMSENISASNIDTSKIVDGSKIVANTITSNEFNNVYPFPGTPYPYSETPVRPLPHNPLPVELKPAEPTFKDELQDLLINSVTSKAIASLLSKHRALDNELDELMSKRRMGELGDILDQEMDEMMNKRRQELRACYVGGDVRYEKIPEWAKRYVKEYIGNMIHGLAILVEDGE
ncbi:hypothetical protein COJ01_17485 [Priestia megaterium]|uniref:hypothetical protein n=1 Tax=Priestia megaterium TaxID=1404 RepID=UPI000BF4BED1|nr:hypothetical protein [Priestia megaterium]PFK99856.1 hypothetical protein COJ01_17485 [Priestia megaterium]